MRQTTYLSFVGDSSTGQVLTDWWKSLDDNRGDRAALRRCRTPFDVALTPAFHRLRQALRESGRVNDEALALVAGLASHVKENSATADFASQMASPKSAGGNAAVSGLRFRRLLRIEEKQELFAALVRTIRLVGGAVNLCSLADSAYWWNENTRKRWASAYYETAPPGEK